MTALSVLGTTFPSSPSPHLPTCRNTGAMLPLLAMLQLSEEPGKVQYCLETLSFMLLDRQNRKMVAELHGLDILVMICGRFTDPNVLVMALEAIVNMVKGDDKDKVGGGGRAVTGRCSSSKRICLGLCV